LTGQNSTGGAIYARTPAPNFDGVSGYIDQTIADYGWYRTIGAINVPIGDKVATRVAATYNTQDSFTDNIGPSPSQPGSKDLISGRFNILFQPTDGMSFDLRYEKFDYDTDYNAVKNRNDAVTSDPFIIQEDARSFQNQEGYRASVEAKIDMASSMRLRVLASKFDVDNQDQADGDRTATAPPRPGPGRVSLTTQDLDTTVVEVNLLTINEGPIQWVLGGFYMDENTPVSVLRDNFNTDDFYQSNSSIIAVADNESWSGFGQFDYRLSDACEVGMGLRYSSDEQVYTRTALPGPPPPGCFPCTSTAESSETTGRLGGKYFMNSDTMFYLTASKGYKAGGVNLDPRLDVFGPETNIVYETGVKTTVADGHLRINADVFYSDYDGIQLSALTSVGAGPLIPSTRNASSGEIKGLEFELLGQFDQLGFNLGMSWINGEFAEDSILTNSLTNQLELVPAGTDLPFSPDVTLTAGIQYDFWFSKLLVTPRLQMSYMDQQYATPFKDEVPPDATLVPSRTVVDLRVMMMPTEALRLEAFVMNLLDETYIAVQLQDASSATGGYIYGAPRQYGIRVKYMF
jgi:iron complex outermembrane receptor protein